MRTNLTLITGGLMAALALYWSLAPGQVPTPSPRKEDPDLFGFVRSMDGTRPDGNLTVADGDALVVDAELGHLFDYYLAGLGEKPLAAIRSQIERELERRLAPAPAREAKRLLGAYLAYKQALAGIEQHLPPSADALQAVEVAGAAGAVGATQVAQAAQARLQAKRALRPTYFTAQESAGLFGAEDARDDDAVARLAVLADSTLNQEQQQGKLTALDAALSPAQRRERDAPQQVSALDTAVRDLRAHGGGDNEVYRLRAATFTPAAAARLAELDRDEAQWQQRITAWRAQKAALGTGGQDPVQVQRVSDALFSQDEQRRLGAYE